MNLINQTNNYFNMSFFTSIIEPTNPCPNQRAITRPLLFVHNYSLFIFGSILNILAFIVLMQGSLRCHSTFAYLAFLSLSNGLLSLIRFVQWLITYYLKIQVENYLYTCRFSHFILDFLTHFSLYTLVCVNIDRARTVTKNRPNTKFSKSAFHTVLIKESIIAIILCAYHLHWLVKFGHEVYDGNKKITICNYDQTRTPTYSYFLSTIYPPFELITFFCLPLFINIICTILILRSLRLRMRTAKRFHSLNQMINESTEQKWQKRLQDIFSCFIPQTTTKPNIYSCFCFQIQCRRHRELRLKIGRTQRSLIKYEEENDSTDRQQQQQQQCSTLASYLSAEIQQITTITSTILNKTHRTRRIRDIHLSAMLIVLNIVYLLLNLPFNFHQTFARKLHENQTDDCIMKFTNLLLDTLQQTYFSTNFFLYVLTNRRFREEFCSTIMKLFTRKQQYLLRRNIQQKQARSLSLIQSTAIISNFNGEYQTMSVPTQQKRESIIVDVELTEASPLQQQTIPTTVEANQFSSKFVISKELPYNHL